jgi:hypothetical protein
VLHVRDEGHVLSSIDQHFIATWWERGYPIDTVLRAVRSTGERLMKRKRPPRGLPLKSMKTVVEREGERAVKRQAAAQPIAPADDGLVELRIARDRVLDALAARSAGDHSSGPLRKADAALTEEISSPSTGGAFVALLRIARCYYDSLASTLSPDRRVALRNETLTSMGEARRRMTPDAIEGTIAELTRRRLQQEDPVLDPRRLAEESDR